MRVVLRTDVPQVSVVDCYPLCGLRGRIGVLLVLLYTIKYYCRGENVSHSAAEFQKK